MRNNLFKKWGETIKTTLQKRKQGSKRKEAKEESQGPEISNTDITIAKIKSQKRKINDMIKKVGGDSSGERVESKRVHDVQSSRKGSIGEGRSCRLNPMSLIIGLGEGAYAGV